MQSTLNQRQTDPYADPHDDVQVACIDEELSMLAHDAMRDPSDPQPHMGSDLSAGPAVPPVDTTFRPAAVNQVPGDRRAGGTRLRWLPVGRVHRCRWHCLAGLWRCGQTDDREVDAAARHNFIATAGKHGASRATKPACRSSERSEGSTSATGTSGSGCPGRRRTCRRRTRVGGVARVDGARTRKRKARDRPAQGQPGTNVPRPCQVFLGQVFFGQGFTGQVFPDQGLRGQGFPGQSFRAAPAADDFGTSAAAGRRAGAQADAVISAAASRRSSRVATSPRTLRAAATGTTTANHGSAAGRTRVFTAAAADARAALAPVLSRRSLGIENLGANP